MNNALSIVLGLNLPDDQKIQIISAMAGSAPIQVAESVKQSPFLGKYCIVRTHSAGVHVGFLDRHNDLEVVLRDSRRIYGWKKSFTLSPIANDGVFEGSKLSVSVAEILLTEAIEIIPCTSIAQKNLMEEKAYEA